MTKEQINEMNKAVEELVDKWGLLAVVDSVIECCYEKANHIRTNWQDAELADTWENAGKSLANSPDVPYPS